MSGFQGCLFARPLPPEEAESCLRGSLTADFFKPTALESRVEPCRCITRFEDIFQRQATRPRPLRWRVAPTARTDRTSRIERALRLAAATRPIVSPRDRGWRLPIESSPRRQSRAVGKRHPIRDSRPRRAARYNPLLNDDETCLSLSRTGVAGRGYGPRAGRALSGCRAHV